MEIHRFEKIWLLVAIALIFGLIGTVTYGAVGAGVKMVNDDGGTINVDRLAANQQTYDPPGDAWDPPGGEWVTRPGQNGDGGHYRVYVLAYQFGYSPDPIRVPADTRVTFHVTSPDVIHGFSVVGTNVNTMVIPGQIAKISTRFTEPGDYGIICHEYCGANHHNMAVNLTVVPQDQFTARGGS